MTPGDKKLVKGGGRGMGLWLVEYVDSNKYSQVALMQLYFLQMY